MSSSTGAGPSRRRGQYSSRACNSCRRRRCKCDGEQPICGTCALHGRECEWSAESDARRPVTKQLVESLRARILTLETEIEQLKRGVGSTTPRATTSPLLGGADNVSEPSDTPALLDEYSDVERPQPPPSSFTPTAMYMYVFQIDKSVPTQLQSKGAQLSLVCDWSRYLPQLPDASLSRLEHDTLIFRCFKYGTSWLQGLVPELFLHDMLYSLTSEGTSMFPQPRLQYYSPLLHCSIMAFASAFSDDPAIRAPATRARFAEYAKRQLDEEFGRPVMSLVPALALLAEYHCGIGERDAGYMYMGMSFRAAYIFVSTNHPVPENNDGIVSIPHSIKRGWHFWSAFSCDKLMAIEYAREYDIPIPHSGISLPSIDADLDNQAWPLEPPLNSNVNTTPARLTTLVFHETCKLMIVATRIIDIIHSRSEKTLGEHMVLNTHLRLDTWFNSLPENLLVWARSTSPLPHVIVLHICYWWLLIVLHQPLYRPSKEKERDQSATEDGFEQRLPIADLSTKICDRAAHKIVQLLTMFDNQHGLRFFPCNMIEAVRTCAIALLRELTSAPLAAVKKKSNAASGVNACINMLRIMSNTWPRARVICENLEQRLQEQHTPSFPITQLDGPAGDQLTKPAIEQEPEDTADISQVFHQYMHDWGHMPVPPGPAYLSSGPGSESPYSQPGELGWDGL